MKAGKRSIADRGNYMDPAHVFGGSSYALPKEIVAYLAKEDLGHKWVSQAVLRNNGGRHPRGWEPLKITDELKKALPANPYKAAAADFFEVGDLVLAVKPLHGGGVSVENHKRYLRSLVEAATKEARGIGADGNPLIADEED